MIYVSGSIDWAQNLMEITVFCLLDFPEMVDVGIYSPSLFQSSPYLNQLSLHAPVCCDLSHHLLVG